jgi:hypothetical protein
LYFKKSLDLKTKTKNNQDLERTMINISLCYAYTNEFLSGKNFADRAIAICGSDCNKEILMEGNFSLGVIYFGQNNLGDSKIHFLKSYTFAKNVNSERFQIDNIVYLSRICVLQNQDTEAANYLSEAEELIKKGSQFNLELIKIYSSFFQYYLEQGDFKKTAFYQNKYIQLKDSIYNEELTTNLMRIEADYVQRENEAKITSQNQVILLKEEVIRRQNLLNASVSVIAVVLIVLAIVLLKNNKQRKMINELLELRVKERTKELELNRNELQRSVSERDLLIEKTAQSIRSSLASIKGICEVGLKDISEPSARLYIQKVEETSDSLSNTLNALSQIQRRATTDSI